MCFEFLFLLHASSHHRVTLIISFRSAGGKLNSKCMYKRRIKRVGVRAHTDYICLSDGQTCKPQAVSAKMEDTLHTHTYPWPSPREDRSDRWSSTTSNILSSDCDPALSLPSSTVARHTLSKARHVLERPFALRAERYVHHKIMCPCTHRTSCHRDFEQFRKY